MDLKIFSIRYPLLRMRPQTLNYWNQLIPSENTICKNRVGNPAKFGKKNNVSFSSNSIDTCCAAENLYKQTFVEASVEGAKLFSRTITKLFNFCREVCVISMDDKYRSRRKIVGYGVHRILKHEFIMLFST